MGGTKETLVTMHENVVFYHGVKLFAYALYLCLLAVDNRLNLVDDNLAVTHTHDLARVQYFMMDHLTIFFTIVIDIFVIVFHVIRLKSIPTKTIDKVLYEETLYRTLEYGITAGAMLYSVNRSRETFSNTEVEAYGFLILVNVAIQVMGFFEPFFIMQITGFGQDVVSNMVFKFIYISATIAGFIFSYFQIFVIHDDVRYDMNTDHKTYVNALLSVLWFSFGLLHIKHLIYALKWMRGNDKTKAENCLLSTAHNFAALGTTAKMLVFAVLGIPNSFKMGRQIIVILLALAYFVALHMQSGAPLMGDARASSGYSNANANERMPLMKLSSATLRNRGGKPGKEEVA